MRSMRGRAKDRPLRVGDGTDGSACGLNAVGPTEIAMLDDHEPIAGYEILFRTTTSAEDGVPKHVWQRAKILSVSTAASASSTLKQVRLRVNLSTGQACTIQANLGSENCGDGSDDGKRWFRVVSKEHHAAALFEKFSEEERAMREKNLLTKLRVRGDGHCQRRAFLASLFGPGADTPERLRQLQQIIASGLEKYAPDLALLAFDFPKESGFDFENYFRARAALLRALDSTTPCPLSAWGGGKYSCDFFSLAKTFDNRLVVIDPRALGMHIYTSKFKVHDSRIYDYTREPGDFVVYWEDNGTHFSPCVAQGAFHNEINMAQ